MISTVTCICGHRLVKRPGDVWFKCYKCLQLVDADGNIKPIRERTILEQYKKSGYSAWAKTDDEKRAQKKENWRNAWLRRKARLEEKKRKK